MMENKTKIDLKNKSVFITGVAGFIGSNLAGRLLSTVEGVKVVGLDNMNHYYDVRLKEARLNELEQFENFSFVKGNLADKAVIESIFEQYKPEIVVNLGAQAGVRYSITKRDFTYVDDIVEGVVRVMQGAPERKNGEDGLPVPPYAVYNIGNQNPENLLDFVQILQEELIRAGVLPEDYDFEAHKKLVPMQPGDVPVTYADTSALERDFGYKPSTSLREGLRKFAEWYAKFYK